MKASCQLLKSKSKSNQLKGGNGMKLKQALKITPLIVILAEEIRSARKTNIELNGKQLAKIVNDENAKNAELFIF